MCAGTSATGSRITGSAGSSAKLSSPRHLVQDPTVRRACADVLPNHSKPHSVHVTFAFSTLITKALSGGPEDPAIEQMSSFRNFRQTAPASSGLRSAQGRSASSWAPSESRTSSPIGGPTSWIDVGRPSSPWSSGSEIAG